MLKQLTAPTPEVRHALHRASALTEQLTDEVLDLALEPLRVLYLQTHIPPARTSNRLGRLGLQRRVEAAHPGGVVEQWLTLRNPSTAQGHWYLHQLLFLRRAALEHRRQTPYHTHPERLGVWSFPQPAPPALPQGQGPELLQQGPPLDTTTTLQQRGSNGADIAEPDCTNCGAVARTPGSRKPGCPPQRTGGRGRATPPGDSPPPAPRHAAPTGRASHGDSAGPPHPRTRTHSTWVADPDSPLGGRQSGEGGRLTSDARHDDEGNLPRGRPSANPTARNASPQGRTLLGRCWVPTPAPTAPGTHGSRNPGCPPQRASGRGRDSA